MNNALWEKKKITKIDENTGEEIQTEEYGERESWKCNVCQRVNEYYIDICDCGHKKSNNKKIDD